MGVRSYDEEKAVEDLREISGFFEKVDDLSIDELGEYGEKFDSESRHG